ncbi:WD40-repeat-containing domain protein [Lasiosphaeria miniovina]|uniref:WD40-repeat-containing domain protein n=1 Tax=Lasiosphaeria miniovina TaxID=1954250 RepID=A0AA40DVP9_9PEZI|nr:WD40-repeat-containing domain protein [Lasiosphaeria miniovina]KAK0717365.1 WD40-repeat-containing domain protein [Lasiosphaeria miniovina]
MPASRPPQNGPAAEGEGDEFEPAMLDEDEAQEVVEAGDDDGDVAMDSDGEDDNGGEYNGEGEEAMTLENDSIAYMDRHKDSVFAIAQHPLYPHLVATGGSEGDADDAPGKGYVIDTSAAAPRPRPVLPPSYNADAGAGPAPLQNTELEPIFAIDGHTDSINALAFTQPRGEYLVSGGMDGRLRVYSVAVNGSTGAARIAFVGESQETEEVTWLAPSPSAEYANTIAFGASDGSVWVLSIDAAAEPAIQIVQSYFLHTGPCTAGAWSPDGLLLATVSEDGSLHVFDVWGAAAAKSLVTDNGQTVVSLTEADQRFAVEGGFFSVAVAPSGTFLAAGGAGGAIRIVSLPRLTTPQTSTTTQSQHRGGSATTSDQSSHVAGTILAGINTQADSIESLSFSPAPRTLLAAGSVDGSIAVFDTSRSFAQRRIVRAAHDGEPVVKVEFVRSAPTAAAAGWLLTSCGLDGVVRRWDLRGATPSQNAVSGAEATGLVKEWRGHRGGGGEGGGVLGFVQGDTGERVVTAGDDSVVLVFEA